MKVKILRSLSVQPGFPKIKVSEKAILMSSLNRSVTEEKETGKERLKQKKKKECIINLAIVPGYKFFAKSLEKHLRIMRQERKRKHLSVGVYLLVVIRL